MKTLTRCALAGAIALAFSLSAGAQTSSGMTAGTRAGATASGTTSAATSGTGGAASGTTSPTSPSTRNDNAMRGPSANSNVPAQCATLTGRDLGQCIKEHGGASGNGISGNPTERGEWGIKNDKSTEGSSGSGNGMGTSAGANDTSARGNVGASGSKVNGAPK